MGILNNRADSVGLALYYGMIASHGHFDRLHFELFANGQPMMPDLGYPDGANDFVPGIFSWSKNTVAHNTTVVDAHRQIGNVPGTVELFANGSFARVIDVSANGTYPQCQDYRRAVIMVDCALDQSYFLDIFTVRGGKEHDYSLHGPPGGFEAIGGQWTEQPRGTLAGEHVEIGQLYDDPKLGAPGYTGGYSSYTGSGFQHLYNVRRLVNGETIAQWRDEKDPTAQLRIRVLDQPNQQLILGNARVSPIKHPEVLTYLIARREGEDLASRFVSVIEPFRNEPLIDRVRQLAADRGSAVSVEVRLRDGSTDVVTYDPQGAPKVAVQRRSPAGEPAGRFAVGGNDRTGAVVDVEAQKSQIRVHPDQPGSDPKDFVGRVVHFKNELRRTAHPIASATRDGDMIVLTTSDDLIVGRARLDAAENDAMRTSTSLPLAPIYRGVTLSNAEFHPLTCIEQVRNGRIKLTAPISTSQRPAAGDDVWFVNVGPGDTFELPGVTDDAK